MKTHLKETVFFSGEYERVFISSFKSNPHYQKAIEYLSAKRFATRNEIAEHLKIKSGGSMTRLLEDLQQCGFIEQYKPYQVKSGRGLYRYCIADPYLRFYYKFISPLKKKYCFRTV